MECDLQFKRENNNFLTRWMITKQSLQQIQQKQQKN